MSVIPQTPQSFRGAYPPLRPLPGLCLEPAEDLKRSPEPSPTHAPLTTNPGSASDIYAYNNHFYVCNNLYVILNMHQLLCNDKFLRKKI